MLGLEDLLERRPGALSGGQRQRVAMGRAIIREPAAFLMDEPLSNLDAKLRVGMRAELSHLHERLNVTTVYVTHDQVEAMTLGQRVAVMRDGYVQQVDTPQTLYRTPANLFVAAFIGSPSMNLVEATVEDGKVSFARVRDPPAGRRPPARRGDPRHPSAGLRGRGVRRPVAADDRGRRDRGRGARLRVPRDLPDRRGSGRRRLGAGRDRRGRPGDPRRRRPPLALHGRGQRGLAGAARDADRSWPSIRPASTSSTSSRASRSAAAGWPRPDQPYRSATARICCAPREHRRVDELSAAQRPDRRRSGARPSRGRARPRRRSACTRARSPRAGPGWIAARPRWPSARPRRHDSASPSRSRTCG